MTGYNGLLADGRAVVRSLNRGGERTDNVMIDNRAGYRLPTGFVRQTFLVGVDG